MTEKRKFLKLLIDYIEPSGWLLQSIEELESFSGYKKIKLRVYYLECKNLNQVEYSPET